MRSTPNDRPYSAFFAIPYGRPGERFSAPMPINRLNGGGKWEKPFDAGLKRFIFNQGDIKVLKINEFTIKRR